MCVCVCVLEVSVKRKKKSGGKRVELLGVEVDFSMNLRNSSLFLVC